jgi:hypothetical protein
MRVASSADSSGAVGQIVQSAGGKGSKFGEKRLARSLKTARDVARNPRSSSHD